MVGEDARRKGTVVGLKQKLRGGGWSGSSAGPSPEDYKFSPQGAFPLGRENTVFP